MGPRARYISRHAPQDTRVCARTQFWPRPQSKHPVCWQFAHTMLEVFFFFFHYLLICLLLLLLVFFFFKKMCILTRDYEPEWKQYIYFLSGLSLQKISLSLNQNILSSEIKTTCHIIIIIIINKRQTLVVDFSS